MGQAANNFTIGQMQFLLIQIGMAAGSFKNDRVAVNFVD